MESKKKITFSIIFLILTVGIVLAGIYFSENIKPNNTKILESDMTGIPDPSGAYCYALGYEIEYHQMGGSYCIFPDKTKCEQWSFYRGKCGQEWSYCNLKKYDMKNLSLTEGWGQDGSICTNKTTKEELGNVYNLINEEWANQNKKN